MNKYISITFWIVIVSFVFVACEFFVPIVQDIFQGPIFFVPIGFFALANGVLVWLVVRSHVDSTIKKFLLVTGVCGVGFLIFILLHNLFYAFGMMTADIVIVRYFFEALHVIFFLIAVLVCPAGFLIGAGGSIWHLRKTLL